MSSFWLILKQQWSIKILSPLFSILSMAAILLGSRDHRTSLFNNSRKLAKIVPYSVFFSGYRNRVKKNYSACWSGQERHIFVSPVDWFRWSLIRSEWCTYFENQSINLNQCSVSSNRLFYHPHNDFCWSLRPWGDGTWNDLV